VSDQIVELVNISGISGLKSIKLYNIVFILCLYLSKLYEFIKSAKLSNQVAIYIYILIYIYTQSFQ